jgi:hypothetical protein
VAARGDKIHFGRYKKRFGYPVTLEHDLRYYSYEDLLELEAVCFRPYTPNCVYKNILTEPLDRIYKFEDLDAAVTDLACQLDLPKPALPHRVAAHKPPNSTIMENPRTVGRINQLYDKDFTTFGYDKKQVRTAK